MPPKCICTRELLQGKCCKCGKVGCHRACIPCNVAYHVRCGHACSDTLSISSPSCGARDPPKVPPTATCETCKATGCHRACVPCGIFHHLHCPHTCGQAPQPQPPPSPSPADAPCVACRKDGSHGMHTMQSLIPPNLRPYLWSSFSYTPTIPS